MTIIRIPGTDAGLPAPMTRSGTPFPFQVAHEGWRFYADDADEILGYLIDGYARQHDERSRLHARTGLAIKAQVTVQNLLNAGELFDHCTEGEIRVLLHDPGIQPVVDEWQCAIPLALVTVFYQPLGELPQPRAGGPGQVWWLDPSTAQSLLETLNGVRWLDLTVAGASGNQAARSPSYPDPPADTRSAYQWRAVHAAG